MKTLLRSFYWVVLGVIVVCSLSSLPVFAKPFPESEVNPLLSTNLQILTRQASGIQPQGDSPGVIDPDEEITVILEPSSGNASRISDSAIRMAGGVVEARSESLVRVRVPIDKLESLADDVAGIVYIREPLRPVPLAVVSQGVALTGAADFHGAGYEGQGVKVAIIDLGFEGLAAAQAAGELQNVVYTWDYIDGDDDVEIADLEPSGIHGTGVAEVVEDMAPQAGLYLLLIGDSVDLQNATQYCIDNGIHIINHSVGWYNSNYYDGTGIIGTIVSNARANDILWVNSAGNEAADGHWQGTFVDTDTDGYHEFAVGSDYLDGDSYDEGNRIYANGGDTVVIYMSWDDWTASDQDYDLYLYDSFGIQVASSTNYQNGFQSPTEAIFYDVTLNGYYEIVIQNYSAPQAPEIEIYVFLDSGGNTGLEFHDPTSTILTPANSADVLAVGAIRRTYWTTGPQESFSSQGPSNASIHSASRIKPDVAGPDRTSSYTYGSFYGTSASSPHVAGAAALLLSEDPGRTADDLQTLLESAAIDMGAVGKDNIYGSGRINLEVTTVVGSYVGYWRFNEGSGSTAADSSTYGNDGTIVGASWVSGSPDAMTALSFDGVNDYVGVPNSVSLNPTSALTIEAWIKPAVLPSGQKVIVEKAHTTHSYPYYQYALFTHSNEVKFCVTVSGVLRAVRSTGAGLVPGTWYHVAGVFDGGSLKIYVDGALRGSSSVTPGSASGYSTEVLIGKHRNVTSERFSGQIDEVKMWQQALVSGEFNLLPGGGPTPPAQVTNFVASDGEDGQSTLTWTNPIDGDLGQVVVQRKTGSYPTDHIDGTTVYDNASPTPGAAVNTTDPGLTNGAAYYYAVFSRDATDWNETVSEGSNADTGTPSEPAPPGSYAAYWRFNEGGGSVAGDSSTYGNDGTIVGASWVSGSPDATTALSFDGVNDYVGVPNSVSLNPTSALTIEAWIKPAVLPSGQKVIVEKAHTTHSYPYYQYALFTHSNEVKFCVTVSGVLRAVRSTGAGLVPGTWYHVAGVFDGGSLKIYVDGALRGSSSVTPGSASGYSTEVLIGKHRNVTSERFSGQIDEVKMWQQALVSGEFNLLPGGGPTPPAQVTNFVASDGEDGQSTLTWTNPIDGDLGQVVVQRKTGSYPTDHIDGTTVYDNASPTPGAAVNTTDPGLTNGAAYYYAVFSRDATDWNETVSEGSNADTGTPSEPAPPGSYAAYWRFNEGGGSVAGDSSTYGNDGTIVGASWVSGSPDAMTALSFDGVNDYVGVPNSVSLNPTSALTIEAWIKPAVLPSGQKVIVEKAHTTHSYPYYQYALFTHSNEVKFCVTVSGVLRAVRSTGAGLVPGTWYHVAGVFDGGSLKIYVDGALRGSSSVTPGSASGYSTEVLIGKHRNVTSERFSGQIDEVKMWQQALVSGEFNLLPAGAPSAAMEALPSLDTIFVAPNPVRSAPAVFHAEGSDITHIAVEIYNFTGTRVFTSGWQAGNTLEWQIQNDHGQVLANGAYLYVVRVRMIGAERRSEPKTLFILR